jgi:hypothetical protein
MLAGRGVSLVWQERCVDELSRPTLFVLLFFSVLFLWR